MKKEEEEKDLADDNAWWSRVNVYVGVCDVIWSRSHAHDLISDKIGKEREEEEEEPLVD